MRIIIGFLRDPVVHLILIGLLLVRLAFLTGTEIDDEDNLSCAFEGCPICKLIRDDACRRAAHEARYPVAVAAN
jgi:hypothetical protein